MGRQMYGMFLATFTNRGAPRWWKAWNGEGRGVAYDAAGNVFVTGLVLGPTDFGAGALTHVGGSEAAIASFTPDGTLRWGKQFGGSQAGHAVPGDVFEGVTVDPDGNVYVTGASAGAANLGGPSFTCQYENCLVVASYTNTGEHRWSKAFPRKGSTGSSYGTRIAVKNGVVAVAGYFMGLHDFGGGDVVQDANFENQQGGIILTLGANNGNVLNQRAVVAGLTCSIYDLKWDANGDLHAVGNLFNGGADLGGGTPLTGGAFRATYGGDLSHKLSKVAGGGAYPAARRIIPRADGTEFVAGSTPGSIDWGHGVG